MFISKVTIKFYFRKARTRLQLLSTATIKSILNFLFTIDQHSNLSIISSMTYGGRRSDENAITISTIRA